MKQYVVTPAAGKRLIAKAMAAHPAVKGALKRSTLVIVAGSTNGLVAEEILKGLGQAQGFDKSRFFRGVTLPPGKPVTDTGRLPDVSEFPGDVVLIKGQWQKGKTIFDVIDDLKEGDVIIKGANAVDLVNQRAGILIGHPKAGTIAAALPAVTGRRVKLIIGVGVEKRVSADLDRVAEMLNAPGASGPRFWPVPGEVITELQAITMLSGASAELVSGGGVAGAEGSVWLAVTGTPEQEKKAAQIVKQIINEPPFTL